MGHWIGYVPAELGCQTDDHQWTVFDSLQTGPSSANSLPNDIAGALVFGRGCQRLPDHLAFSLPGFSPAAVIFTGRGKMVPKPTVYKMVPFFPLNLAGIFNYEIQDGFRCMQHALSNCYAAHVPDSVFHAASRRMLAAHPNGANQSHQSNPIELGMPSGALEFIFSSATDADVDNVAGNTRSALRSRGSRPTEFTFASRNRPTQWETFGKAGFMIHIRSGKGPTAKFGLGHWICVARIAYHEATASPGNNGVSGRWRLIDSMPFARCLELPSVAALNEFMNDSMYFTENKTVFVLPERGVVLPANFPDRGVHLGSAKAVQLHEKAASLCTTGKLRSRAPERVAAKAASKVGDSVDSCISVEDAALQCFHGTTIVSALLIMQNG